jgi:rSAM/selenodomain-associated transferase 1
MPGSSCVTPKEVASITDGKLIVFAKVPDQGKVKTRLAWTVGDEAAYALYRCFVADTLALARRARHETEVFFYPPEAAEAAADWLGSDVVHRPQNGADLGERMSFAFQAVFRGSSRAVLIGSDIPDLPLSVLDNAFEGLRTDDVVIGPARDGGYYLIGFSAHTFTIAPFDGILWGGPHVFEDTMSIFRKMRLSVCVLPTWNDIDDYDDLRVFFDAHRNLVPGALLTVDYLRDQLGW